MFKIMSCWLLMNSLLMAPALAEIEYSGNQTGARQAQPALKSLICNPALFGKMGSECKLDAVRLIGDWAWVAWSGKEAGGMSVLRRQGNNWMHITGGGGAMIVSTGIEAGVPRAIAEQLIPIQDFENVNELAILSAWELSVIRNRVYARHGRRFNDRRLQAYFETWPWYHPKSNYQDSMLSVREQRFIALVLSVEKQKGYLR